MADFKQNYFQRRTKDRGPRSNNRISSPEVQVIASNGDNLGTTTIFLLLFKYFTKIMLYEKFNKINQEEWIFFTLIFIFSFVIVFLLNIVINLSVPELSPTFFHIGVTLILFPIMNIGINFFSFVTQLIKS